MFTSFVAGNWATYCGPILVYVKATEVQTFYSFFIISTVISSTLPIMLKCSSPGIRFTIDEIYISLSNGTNVFVTSTSDSLRQCEESRQQMKGRHECQFTLNYGNFGIDKLSVNSVAVKYHCFSE